MSASYAPSGKPIWAVTCWTDSQFIYTELPVKDGPPLIQKYALTEGGFTKALALQKSLFEKLAPTGGYHKLIDHPIIKVKPSRSKYVNSATKEQRQLVHELLKKKGVI